MKILITTPLYPPEIAEIAVYSKTLAEKLSINHKITLLAYANHPLKAQGFSFIYVLKNKNFFTRIFLFFKALIKNINNQEILFLQSGISASLPAFLIAKIKNKKIVFRYFEDEPEKRAQIKTNRFKIIIIKTIQKIILKYSDTIICSTKLLKEKLINIYKTQNNKITIIEDPQNKKIILPFRKDKIPQELLQNTYVKNILEKGNEENKISWEEHVLKLEKQFFI